MSDVFTFAVLALATFRLQHFVTVDNVPGAYIRNPVERRFGNDSKLAELVHCPWCVSVYVGVVVFVEHYGFGFVPLVAYGALAAMAVSGLLGEWESRG